MSNCFQPWIDNFNACSSATGGLSIPGAPTPDNVNNRIKICATLACQQLFSVFRSLIASKCQGALDEVKKFPEGMYTTTYCPVTPPTTAPPTPPPTTKAPTTTQPPTTTTPPPAPTTKAPPTTTAVPIPTTTTPTTTAPPPEMTTKAPEGTTATPTVTTMTPTTAKPTEAPTISNGSESPATSTPPVSPTPTALQIVSQTPAPLIVDAKSGISTTTIAAAGGGSLVIIPTGSAARNDKLDQPHRDDGFAYANLSDARTDDTMTGSDLFRGGLALAAVRIPPETLQLGDVVSQGGFGEVLRGVYRNEVVAIKRLLASRRKDPHNIRSFFKEIQLTAALDHECIVRFIGVSWDVPANLCMVSEYMHGGDLRSRLARYSQERRPNGHDDGKLRIAVQVAHALTYLHSLDVPVVHRDLKSRNILLTESMDAKLIDFGISCERQDVTMTAGVGTSLWMAPEVMLGKRYDEKADVFSFGVILSELDTHELPYDHARDTSSNRKMADMVLMNLISTGKLKPRFTRMAAPDMVALARDCLEVDPARRPLAAQVLYRIHQSRQHDQMLTSETRTAITRSLFTADTSTRTTTRYSAIP